MTKVNNMWRAAILNGNGGIVCSRTGGVTVLPNFGFRIGAPVVQCLGGAHILRVGGAFVEDQDPSDVADTSPTTSPTPGRTGLSSPYPVAPAPVARRDDRRLDPPLTRPDLPSLGRS